MTPDEVIYAMTMDDKPIIVFIDTSAFERENFAFGGELLESIVESCNDSLMELVMVDVTADEIRRRIRNAATAAAKAMKTVLKNARLLCHDRDVWPKIRDRRYYLDLGDQVVSAFDKYLESANVTYLKADDVRPSDVFQKYFSVDPPFSFGKKEKEFPDAFAVEAVLHLSKTRGRNVYVVSADSDFIKACNKHECLIHLAHVESAIEYSLRTPDAVIDACHELLHDNIEDVIQRAEQRLNQVQFSLDAPSGYINSISHLDMECRDEAVVELEDTHAVIVASMIAQVSFNVEYDTEGDSYYDADDRLVIPYNNVHRDLDVYLLFPVKVTVSISMRDVKNIQDISFDVADEAEITPNDDWEFEIHKA